jgi:Regulator of ribonuclease activity B
MSLVAELMDMAVADTDVLRSLNSNGDDFSKFREVDFLLIAPSPEKAQVICGFINDHSYGSAKVTGHAGSSNVQVLINMPVEQPIILCVSGFMACVAHLFGAKLDGWGCATPKHA